MVCGTPWSGKEALNTNVIVPLSAICILTRGEQNAIEPVSFHEIYPILFAQIYKPSGRDDVLKTMAIIKNLAQTVRFYRLRCNRDPQAAFVAYNGMRK